MNSYTTIKKKREEFRQNLIRLLMAKDDNIAEGVIPDDFNPMRLIEQDDDLLKYYYYIMHGIDDVHVAPIDTILLNKILNLIPIKWRMKFKSTMTRVIRDAREDYASSIKKSIVDFVLQDPLKEKEDSRDRVREK